MARGQRAERAGAGEPRADKEITECAPGHAIVIRGEPRASPSGTARFREMPHPVPANSSLTVQGDEPLTRSEHIAALIEAMQDASVQVGTLMTPAATVDIDNPSAVKVVTDSAGRALYF